LSDDPTVWRGFHFRWGLTSHRLPLLHSQLREGVPEFGLKVGGWPPDRARVTTRGCRLVGADVVARGEVAVRVTSHVSEPGVAEVAFAVPSVDDRDVAVVLDGFAITALVNPAGWHVGGIGVELVRRGDGWIARASMRPAESPHPGIFGLGDWDWDQPCSHDVVVGWAAVAVSRGAALEEHGEARVGSALGTTIVDWEPAMASGGTRLLTGFSLRIDASAQQQRRSGYLRNLNGRYLRELGVGIEDGRPAVHVANAPRLLIRLGAVLGLYAVAAMALFTIVVTPHWVAGAAVFLALAVLTWVWPRVWVQAPAVPFALRASVSTVRLDGVEAESLDATWDHTEVASRPAIEG